ncbi:hypothetical protein [Deinococcus humi]|uniref:Uncharacterized protein n=1 Tax=Deinococcus humi TaxID=662880 RepID=A0A7W8JV64_9DEIO|nr:hypothetical protein [Deinococcus humi]MBB5363724.1 hypothetical protein [Deinococcus humi]
MPAVPQDREVRRALLLAPTTVLDLSVYAPTSSYSVQTDRPH